MTTCVDAAAVVMAIAVTGNLEMKNRLLDRPASARPKHSGPIGEAIGVPIPDRLR